MTEELAQRNETFWKECHKDTKINELDKYKKDRAKIDARQDWTIDTAAKLARDVNELREVRGRLEP